MDPEITSAREQKKADLVEKIKVVDGTLIPLANKTRLGEEIFLSLRYGEVNSLPDVDHLLLVDVFSNKEGGLFPIGHYDWEISGSCASGNKNRHGGHLPNQNTAHKLADKAWGENGFDVYDKSIVSHALDYGGTDYMSRLRKMGVVTDESQWTDPAYQKQGLGSLMIAVSAIALKNKGVKQAELGTLSKSARATWKKFGQSENKPVSTEELIKQQRVKKAIEKFV